MFENLSREPLVLNHNRVKRAYIGGSLLNQWQGLEPGVDNHFPEEFLISTVEVTNAEKYSGEGLSKVALDDGREVPLRDIVASEPDAFLGRRYSKIGNGDLGVLARVGDTTVRLVIQAHPDRECAKKYLNFPNGKTEAWYILDCRDIEGKSPYVYAGFRPGLTRQHWEELFKKQDIQGMLDAMHVIPVKQGDVLLIEAGMPHAIGPGIFFLEVHEPCDYTLRLERKYLTGRVFPDEEIHYGMGYEKLFDCFHYETYTPDEILEKVVLQPSLVRETPQAKEFSLVTYDHTDRFAINKINLTGEYHPAPFSGHYIAIVTRGHGTFHYTGGRKPVRQGQGVFLPDGVQDLKLVSVDGEMEVVVAFPPKLDTAA